MVGFFLPQCTHFPDKKALNLHQRRYPAAYEYIHVTADSIIRYYADEPAVRAGDFVCETIKDVDSYVYIERLDNHTVYAVFVEHHQVSRELCGTIDTLYPSFEYCYHQGIPFFVTDDTALHHYPTATLIESVAVVTLPEHYHLLAIDDNAGQTPLQKIVMAVTVLFMIIASGTFLYKTMNPPPPPIEQQVDPIDTWRDALFNKTPASAGLTNIATALSYFYLLPSDWGIGEVGLSSSQLNISVVQKDNHGLDATLTAWLHRYPEIAALFDKETSQFSMPIKAKHDAVWFQLGNYPETLRDTLLTIGASTVTRSIVPSIGEVKQWHYTAKFDDVPFALLNTLAQVLTDKPVFLDTITVSQGTFYTYISFEMTLTLEGLTHES